MPKDSDTFIYGPVASRRLGRSLGVDLVPRKVCSYDCVYCQLGRTKKKTVQRKPYVESGKVLDQLHHRLKQKVRADFITLGGSGEPTLNSQIGLLIGEIKKRFRVPVAVLTNSSLLSDIRVRESLMEADAVLPSLDAHDPEGFESINRPHPDITFETMVEGLIAFGKEYPGEIWLEVFVLAGLNATESDAMRFKSWTEMVNPQKIHLNTAVRPTAETYAKQVLPEGLAMFCKVMGEKAEVITPYLDPKKHGRGADFEQDLLSLLARRPCTVDDISSGLDLHRDDILKHVESLVKTRRVDRVKKGSEVYYQPGRGEDPLGE